MTNSEFSSHLLQLCDTTERLHVKYAQADALPCTTHWLADLRVIAHKDAKWQLYSNRHTQHPRLGLSAPSTGDDLRSKSAIRLRGHNCTQRCFECLIVRPPTLTIICPDSMRFFAVIVAVAMRFAMKNGQIEFASHCGNSLQFRLRFKNR